MATYTVDLHQARWGARALVAGAVVVAHLPSGVGPECPLRSVTGVPCPFCGMTTSMRALGGGHVVDSFRAAPLAPVLAVLAVGVAVGRLPARVNVGVWVLALLIGAEWIYELTRFHVV